MRRLVAVLLLSTAPIAASAQSFDSQIQANIGTQFGSGGGNTTEEQFIGNNATAEGSGRDMTRTYSSVPSNAEVVAREAAPYTDQTRLIGGR